MSCSITSAKQRQPALIWFSLLNLAVCLIVFRQAMWGGALLAPLDLLPACFTQYRFMDPENSGVPAANAQFDQVVYDLPLQHGIYEAYHRYEVPWWDPYGFSGRPLLADAHINGTDPVRLLAYGLLPFELAYNWTLIGHFFLSGLTLFLLLRWWRFPGWLCIGMALTFEFAGSQTFFFGYPWIHASLLYYPLLWLCWDAALTTGRKTYFVLASLAVAAIFYAGNLQSHAYLVLFSATLAVGYGWHSVREWRRMLMLMTLSGLCGACLAAPVLLNQVEFYILGVRGVKTGLSGRVYLTGLACLSSIYPWLLGDFRTLDLRSAFFKNIGPGQNYGLGFHTYIGSAGLVLALFGSWVKVADAHLQRVRRTAICLAVLFLLIVSSPLIAVFYTRAAGLFVLGGVILCALGLQALADSAERFPRWGAGVAALAATIAVASNVGALVIYPRLLPKIQHLVQQHEVASEGTIFKMAAAYRAYQITNFPNEVSFRNLEAFVAFLSLGAVAAALFWTRLRQSRTARALLISLNVIPAILFCERFVPRQSTELWQRLLAGGPAQQHVVNTLGPDHLRVRETAAVRNQYVFPDALEHLYRVHTVHGYSALVPVCLLTATLNNSSAVIAPIADYVLEGQTLRRETESGLARFRWLNDSPRTVKTDESSLNALRLEISSGPAATLLWTDTWYPGWTASIDGKPAVLRHQAPAFSKLEVPAGARTIVFTYRPRFLTVGLMLSGLSALTLSAILAVNVRRRELPNLEQIHVSA